MYRLETNRMKSKFNDQRRYSNCTRTAALILVLVMSFSSVQGAEKILVKNLADIEGNRTNPLVGIGFVAGLNGTGGKTPITRETLVNFTQRIGQRVDPLFRALTRNDTQLKTDNVSVVAVTADLRVTDRPGQVIDVTVAALDDAKSLQGGMLMMTPLYGADQRVYAVASGTVSIGGFSFSGDAASVVKNHPTKGMSQGRVELPTPMSNVSARSMRLLLRDADATTAVRVADAINDLSPGAAHALDSAAIDVQVPPEYWFDKQRFVSMVQQLPVEASSRARVVVNEATGTIIIGGDVKLSPDVALAHANLSITTGETPEVSQPLPFSQGETAVVPRTEITVEEESNSLSVIKENATVADLAQALNALGVTPRDLGMIFLNLRAQGALRAELIIK